MRRHNNIDKSYIYIYIEIDCSCLFKKDPLLFRSYVFPLQNKHHKVVGAKEYSPNTRFCS